jgi:hypothetical protein
MLKDAAAETAVPVIVPVTEYGPLVGPAVNVPSLAIVPPVAAQLIVLPAGGFVTVALNFCWAPGVSTAPVGETAIEGSVAGGLETARRFFGGFSFLPCADTEGNPPTTPAITNTIRPTTAERSVELCTRLAPEGGWPPATL